MGYRYTQIWLRKKSRRDESLVEKQTKPFESQGDGSFKSIFLLLNIY